MEIKEVIKNYLTYVKDAFLKKSTKQTNHIKEHFTWDETIQKNKVWYHGDVFELSQFWTQNCETIDARMFWSALKASKKMPPRHYPLPKVMVDSLKKIVTLSYNRIEIDNEEVKELWETIDKENDFLMSIYDDAIKKALITGDGAFAINLDSEYSKYPIFEVVDGSDLQYEFKYGKPYIVDRYKEYKKDGQRYVLVEKHYLIQEKIEYKLFDDNGNEISKSLLEETKYLPDVLPTPGYKLLIPFKVYDSEHFKGRGESIYEGCDSAFDMLDETLSTLGLSIRKNKSITAAPAKIGKDGEREEYNEFDTDITLLPHQKVANGNDRDAAQVQLQHINPTFDVSTYDDALRILIEIALIGKESSTTIGFDTRTHTDPNAAFDKEREKITYHTCNDIQEAFKGPIIQLIKNSLYVCRFLGLGEIDVDSLDIQIVNDEFASPSFEEILTITNQAVAAGNMSRYRSIQYQEKDFTEEQIQEEIERIESDKQDNYMHDDELFGVNEPQFEDNENNEEKDKEEESE